MAQTRRVRVESGAVLIHVALALLVLIAFSALAIDYGIMWASRTQAQAAADAGALSGAISLAYGPPPDNPDNFSDPAYVRARAAASTVAQENAVWGQAPGVVVDPAGTFPCPADAEARICGATPGCFDRCLEVQTYRNQQAEVAGNEPLPTFFARLVGVDEQGVRATATAAILSGSSTPRCMKPFALPDRWLEGGTTDSQFGDFFESPPDVYNPDAVRWQWPQDYGTTVILHTDPSARITSSFAQLVVLVDPGGDPVRDAIMGCVGQAISVGDDITVKTGGTEGPVKQAVDWLRDTYPLTLWDHAAGELSCGDPSGCDNYRLGAIPVFRPSDAPQGSGEVEIVDVIGIYIEGMGTDNDVEANHPELVAAVPKVAERMKMVVAHIVPYAGVLGGGGGPPRPSSFLRTVVLIR